MAIRRILHLIKPYFVYFALSILLFGIASLFLFPQGGYAIEDYDRWVVVRFWKSLAILFPVSAISVYLALRFGALRVSILAISAAVIHVAIVSYLTWVLSGLDPSQSAFEGYMEFVEMKGWTMPVANLLKDVLVPVICLLLVRHLTSHSNAPLWGGTPDGAP